MEIIVILITWYMTKLYYTGRLSFDIHPYEDRVKAICVKCSKTIWVDKDNVRSPYYCVNCK